MMGLSVSLRVPRTVCRETTGIFMMEYGEPIEIYRADWDLKFPWFPPTILESVTYDAEVFSKSITHNLTNMADALRIYTPVWRPEDIEITKAEQLIELLTEAVSSLRKNPGTYKVYDSPNVWGTYETLRDFLEEYLEACKKYPKAEIKAYR